MGKAFLVVAGRGVGLVRDLGNVGLGVERVLARVIRCEQQLSVRIHDLADGVDVDLAGGGDLGRSEAFRKPEGDVQIASVADLLRLDGVDDRIDKVEVARKGYSFVDQVPLELPAALKSLFEVLLDTALTGRDSNEHEQVRR